MRSRPPSVESTREQGRGTRFVPSCLPSFSMQYPIDSILPLTVLDVRNGYQRLVGRC